MAAVLARWAKVLDPEVELYYRDTARVLYPYKQFVAERLRRLELPLWYPWNGGGSSLLGELVAGVFHPTNILYLALPFDLAFKLQHLSVQLLAGLGTYLLARRLACGRAAALAGAFGYAFSGYVVSQAGANLTYALGAATVPLAVHGLLLFLEAPRPGRLLWASFALAGCVLAGEPQSALFAALLGVGWALAHARSQATDGNRRRAFLHAVGATAAWAFVALLLSSPALLPGLVQVGRSSRAEGIDAPSAGAFANRPVRLIGLALPGAFDDTQEQTRLDQSETAFWEYFASATTDTAFSDSIALGLPLLLLAAVAARERRSGRVLLGGALCFLVLSTGDAFGVQSLLFRAIPGWRLFRYAEKFVAPASLLLALAAAEGIEAALGGPAGIGRKRRPARDLLALCLVVAALDAALWLWLTAAPKPLIDFLRLHGRSHQEAPALAFASALSPSLLGQAALTAVLAATASLRLWRPQLPAAALGAGTCGCSVAMATAGLLFVAPVEIVHGPFPLADALRARAGESAGRYRIWSDSPKALVHKSLDARLGRIFWSAQALHPQMNALARIENAASYSALDDRDLTLAVASAPAAIASLFGVRFVVRDGVELPRQQAVAAGFTEGPFHLWVRDLPPVDRAFLIGPVKLARDARAAADLLAAPGFDPRRSAVLLEGAGGAFGGAGATGRVESLERTSPEELQVHVDLPAPALLVISEHFDPGWRALLDGSPVSALQVDLAALGVQLPAGRHRVVLRFRPRGLALGGALAAGTLLLLAAAEIARRRAQTRCSASTALAPPNPKELETAAEMRTSRAWLGT
jgi:hypothetical protein